MRNSKGQFVKGNIPWVTGKTNVTGKFWLGKKRSPETIAKISQKHKGLPAWNKGKSFLAGVPKPWISIANKGNKYNFKGNPIRNVHGDAAYWNWHKIILKRDNFKCRMENNNCKGNLEVHHILPWRDYINERYNPNNGITLCHYHHPHKWRDEKEMTPIFQELIKQF